MGVKWQASAANFSLRARVQRAQTRGYGVSGSRQLDLSVVQLLHLRQDQLGLGLVQFADEQRDHLPAAVREYGEREYRRGDPKRRGGVESVLLADEQRIADLESVGELQHLVAMVHGDPDHARAPTRPFGLQGLEQRYFAAAGGGPGGPEVDDQGLAGKGRGRGGLAGGVLQGALRQPIRELGRAA